ncbi:uncharacterized protein METZ01_LOCUS450497 [marine metagenome]|uniref:Uncharacterized protein n=1 Tax=marine metagenome TaxID=408172 RepID=A0A382ZQE9_9ZZZZ
MNCLSISGDELRDLLLSVGSHQQQRRLSPVEVANLFQREINAGASVSDCARLVHLDGSTMVNRFLKLRELDPAIQHNVGWGQSGATIGFTIASEVAKLPRADHVPSVRAVLELSLKKNEVLQIVQVRRKTGRELESVIDQIVKTRPTFIKKYLFLGSITNENIKRHLLEKNQEERDNLLQLILIELALSDSEGARLGGDKFSIIGGEAFAERTKCLEPDFETAINNQLGKLVSE